MSKTMYRVLSGLLVVGALVAGCVPLPAPAGSTGAVSTSAVATEPAATATLPVTSTVAVTATVALSPTVPVSPTVAVTATTGLPPTAAVSTSLPPSTSLPITATVTGGTTTPEPGAGTAGQGRQITLDDNGKTITLQPGERVLLYLGEGYNWDVSIGDPTVISRVPGILTIRGSQGLFEARQEGSTTLDASGDPPCRQSQPPCEMPSRIFEIQVVVKAGSS